MSRVVKQSTFLCDSEKRKYPHFLGEIYDVLSIVPKFFVGILRKRKNLLHDIVILWRLLKYTTQLCFCQIPLQFCDT
jgi:hypothetical protein